MLITVLSVLFKIKCSGKCEYKILIRIKPGQLTLSKCNIDFWELTDWTNACNCLYIIYI